jgi:dCMP deaminase
LSMDENRLDEDEAYMQMAEVWAKRSYATRSKVGALLVKNRTIISDGFNGMPSGMPNEEIEWSTFEGVVTNQLVIHAEANLFDKLSRNGSNSGAEGATMYVTLSPCMECAKRIINNKIKRIVYRNKYRIADALPILISAGIEVVQLQPEAQDV